MHAKQALYPGAPFSALVGGFKREGDTVGLCPLAAGWRRATGLEGQQGHW